MFLYQKDDNVVYLKKGQIISVFMNSRWPYGRWNTVSKFHVVIIVEYLGYEYDKNVYLMLPLFGKLWFGTLAYRIENYRTNLVTFTVEGTLSGETLSRGRDEFF